MTKPTALEQRRLEHINFLMNEIHDSTNDLYEFFVEKEYDKAKGQTRKLINRLREIIESLEDEI